MALSYSGFATDDVTDNDDEGICIDEALLEFGHSSDERNQRRLCVSVGLRRTRVGR